MLSDFCRSPFESIAKPGNGLRIISDSGSILNSIEVTVASAQVASLFSYELMTTSLLPDESLLAALTESAEIARGDWQRVERAMCGWLEPMQTAVRRGHSRMQISSVGTWDVTYRDSGIRLDDVRSQKLNLSNTF